MAYEPGTGTAPLAMQIGRTGAGLVGFGAFPGFKSFGMDAVGIELPASASVAAAPPEGDYLFSGGTLVGVNYAPAKGSLRLRDFLIEICPEVAAIVPACTAGSSYSVRAGGPLWHTTDGFGSFIVLPNAMLAYRYCHTDHDCTTLIALPTQQVRNVFTGMPNSYGRSKSETKLKVLVPDDHPVVTPSAIPGIFIERTTGASVIQSIAGDYIAGGRTVFVAR